MEPQGHHFQKGSNFALYPETFHQFHGDNRIKIDMVLLKFYNRLNELTMGLYSVLYIPEIAKNLVSVSAMTKSSGSFIRQRITFNI